jgi:hypothetical protein
MVRAPMLCSSIVGTMALCGCAGTQNSPPVAFAPKPSISSSDVIGRWGLGAYHREEDRARTEAITKGQCGIPYVISPGNGSSVMMLTHDSPNIVEVQIKADQAGKTFIGPGLEPGAADDREVVSYNGRVLILRWVDPEVAGRYGTQLLVRCAFRNSHILSNTTLADYSRHGIPESDFQ